MSTEQELAAADMHLMRLGLMDTPEAVDAAAVVRVFTGPGRYEYVDVRAHRDGWVELTAHGGVIVKPVASNLVMVRPERQQ